MMTDTVSPVDRPVVRTKAGAVRGRWRMAAVDESGMCATSAAFLGIPYAEAPVGELRFAAPTRRQPWDGVRDAAVPGPTAQRAPLQDVTTIPEPTIPGEDILNLNVFTPAPGDPDAQLPVMVWIHGGGYMAGCASSPWYDGAPFNRNGIVTVSIGYRLGIDGWLHLDGAPDNRGALDWLAALTWVQENIRAFGGDPTNVTIAGQSAGGGAVLTLLTIPSARGLFHRAISVSGAIGTISADEARVVSTQFSALAGVPATAAAAGSLSDTRTQQLVEELNQGVMLRLVPFPDGELIPLSVPGAIAIGMGSTIPLMLGFTANEFNQMAQSLPDTFDEHAATEMLIALGLPGERVNAYLAPAHGGDVRPLVGQGITDAMFRSVGLAIAEQRGTTVPAAAAKPARGHASGPGLTGGLSQASSSTGTWLYQFDWGSRAPHSGGLAFHCLDLPFAWNILRGERVTEATGPNPPQSLADQMHRAWTQFIIDGDPGWPQYQVPDRETMIWDAVPVVRRDPLAPVRAMWL